MTEKLYYENPYLKECEAEIVQSFCENEKNIVVLDKTPFYPEGGGQPCDLGKIDNIKVLDVYEDNDVIYHVLEKTLENKKVFCSIDFNRRFDLMQQHSGEHLLAGAIYKLYKGNNKGFHLGEDYVTLDIDIETITDEMVKNIEAEVNSYIFKNQEIKTCIVSKEDISKFPLRKSINVDEAIRIVEAKDMDCCACCGTHVLRTGEVGLIKIIKTERYKGMTRIYFKSGNRALKDFQHKHEVVSKLTRSFSSDEYSLIETIENQISQADSIKKELVKLKKKLAEIEAEQLVNQVSYSTIFKKYNDKSFEDIQLIASFLEKEEYVVIIASSLDNKIIFQNNSKYDVNCGGLFKGNIKEFNGKGGGNAKKAQGTFENEEDLDRFSTFLLSSIEPLTHI